VARGGQVAAVVGVAVEMDGPCRRWKRALRERRRAKIAADSRDALEIAVHEEPPDLPDAEREVLPRTGELRGDVAGDDVPARERDKDADPRVVAEHRGRGAE